MMPFIIIIIIIIIIIYSFTVVDIPFLSWILQPHVKILGLYLQLHNTYYDIQNTMFIRSTRNKT